MKNLSKATKPDNSVPKRSKSPGLVVFSYPFWLRGIILLFAHANELVMNGHLVIAGFVVHIASLLAYSIVKMMTADDTLPL